MRKANVERELAACIGDRDEAQRQAAALEARLTQLEQALSGLPQAVFVVDAGGQPVFDSSGAEQLLRPGHTAALVRPIVDRLLRAALEGTPSAETVRVHGPPMRVLDVSANAIHTRGTPIGAVAVVEDASPRHQLDAVRRDFIANVSHELRTPVGALGVLAEAMAGEDSPAALRRLASRVGIEATRAAQLIADLLDLSRIEANGIGDATLVDVAAVVEAAVERVRELAGRRGVTLAVNSAPAETIGDEAQLVSAVTNLLENAVKYTDAGGSVSVSVGSGDSGGVRVVVADTGIGIPLRDQARIFERFYRVDRGRSRDTGGTGLGLSIVRHVAQNHGGDVVVDSTEGEGSTFTLLLGARHAGA